MNWQKAPDKKTGQGRLAAASRLPFKSLVLPFILILALAIFCTSFVTYLGHRRSLEQSLFQQAEVRAHENRDFVQNHLQNKLDGLLNQGRNLVGHYNIRQQLLSILKKPHKPTLGDPLRQSLMRSDDNLSAANITLIDSHALQLFNYRRKPTLSIEDPDIATGLKGVEFSDIVKDKNIWMLRATIPLQENGRTLGALVLTLELNLILEEYANEHRMKMALADENGIQAPGNTSWKSLQISQQQIETVLSGGPMQTSINPEKTWLYHYMNVRVGYHKLVLLTGIDLSPTAQILDQKQQESLQLTLILLATLLPISAWIVHRLLYPLITLRKRAAEVAENLAGIPLQDYQGNTINRLVNTFEAMASALEEHEEARQRAEALLQQEHATLEVKVRDRTRELERSNGLLQREIAERTHAQRKAEGLQDFLANLIDAMPSLLIGIDHKGLINQWNHEAEKLSGLSYDRVSGHPFAEALPWPEQLHAKVENTLQQGVPNKFHHIHWEINNLDKTVDIMIYPLTFERQGGAVIRIDDVTERNRLDELIVQTEKMMSVGGLAAGMAHEINNPLASIIQSAQVIGQRLSPELPKNNRCAETVGVTLETINAYLNERQIPKMLTSILDSGQRAGEIVKNMLSFTCSNDSIRSTLKISDLLDHALEHAMQDYDLKKHHNIRQIEIVRRYAENLPQLLCNSGQMEQVCFNIIQNSTQAISAASEMTRAPRIELVTSQRENLLLISISDNGPGIDNETQKRIFEPFFTTKDVGLGTGLGLSVAYFIVTENHGGQLNVESTLGEGTRFNILLPLIDAPVAD